MRYVLRRSGGHAYKIGFLHGVERKITKRMNEMEDTVSRLSAASFLFEAKEE